MLDLRVSEVDTCQRGAPLFSREEWLNGYIPSIATGRACFRNALFANAIHRCGT